MSQNKIRFQQIILENGMLFQFMPFRKENLLKGIFTMMLNFANLLSKNEKKHF